MSFGKIDDPVDASYGAWKDEPDDLGSSFANLALKFSGLHFPQATVLRILGEQFFPGRRVARICYLLDGFKLGLKQLQAQFENSESRASESREVIKALESSVQAKLDSPQFEAAVSVACEEAVRATNHEKVRQFAQVLVGSLTPKPWHGPPEDVAMMIRDLAQLGEQDILVLRELVKAFEGVGGPGFNLVPQYAANIQGIRDSITRTNFHPDDFYSTCARLYGFGLVLEEQRNPSHFEAHERLFRPTHRGITLVEYLQTPGIEMPAE